MCAFFFLLFFSVLFFFLHSPLLTPSSARRERHAYCDFVGGRRNGGAWSRRSCMAVMFCWWCIHCVGAVRVKSWQAAPPPAPCLLPAPSSCGKHVLCFMLRTTFGLRLQLQLQLRLLVWVWVRIQVRVFDFECVGWVCYGLKLGWRLGLGLGLKWRLGCVDRVCCLGSHCCDWGLFMAHGFWVTFWYHVLAANFPSPFPFLTLSL